MNFEDVVLVGGTCDSWHDSLLLVHVSQVTAKIARLCKSLSTEMAVEGSHLCVLAEVIPQVTTFTKGLATSLILASEVKFYTLGLWVLDLDSLMPLRRDTLELLWLQRS